MITLSSERVEAGLRLHELTTQLPHKVWLAIDEKARKPRVSSPPIHVVRFSGTARTFGVEQRSIEGVPVKLYDPAKTVADCFKYRNKISLDVALEALRGCWRRRKATMPQFHQAAKVCRVAGVMQPYIESLTCAKRNQQTSRPQSASDSRMHAKRIKR